MLGTPMYAAPEQLLGDRAGPLADQYSFCVTAYEAYAGQRPFRARTLDALLDRIETAQIEPPLPGRKVPARIARALTRGLSARAEDRFPSMAALLAVIAPPARRWPWVVAAASAAAAIAFTIGAVRSSGPPACAGVEASLAAVWSPAERGAVVAHVRGLGPFGAAEADRLAAELDGYATGWIDQRRAACEAHADGALPPALYERRVACLERASDALGAIVEVMTSVKAPKLGTALVAARSLPSPGGCADADADTIAPPPAAIAARVAEVRGAVERARMLDRAASPAARDAAEAAARDATALGYAPLTARADLVAGWALVGADRPRAIALLGQAFRTAVRAGDDVVAIEAYTRGRFLASRAADYQPVAGQVELIEDLAVRSAPRSRFALALFYNNLGTERLVAEDRAGARERFRAALDVWRPPIGDAAADLELVMIVRNLSLVEVDLGERVRLAAQAAAMYDDALGPAHPWTIGARIQEALLTADPEAAAAKLAAVCPSIAAYQARLRRNCAWEQAWLALDRGDAALAGTAMAAAAGDPGDADRSDQDRIATAYRALTGGDAATRTQAIAALRALAADRGAKDWFIRADAADALVLVARALDAAGDAAGGTAAWADALALLVDHPTLERRTARIQATLAERWRATRPAEARALATAARDWYRAATHYDAEVTSLSAIADAN
jgi:hypothetical protein